MNRELRQRERHALRRLFAELVGFIKCKFSFWVESFEVRLSSDTDKWDIKGGIHNAGMEKLNFLNTFLFFRLCIKASLNREFSSAQKSFKISRFNNLVLCKSDAEEAMSFCSSTRSNWTLFGVTRINVLLKSQHDWTDMEKAGSHKQKLQGDVTVLNTLTNTWHVQCKTTTVRIH